jgi:DNA primase
MKEEIRARLDFRELVSEYVALKPSGRDKWKGLSPFSKEKTPSFYVDVAKGVWYCFSTKQGGDPFDFLMKVEGISFRDALVKLAQRTGVQFEDRPEDKRRRDVYEVNALALAYFQASLREASGAEARAYLERRGVSQESIEAFALGWAPAGYDNLLKHAKARGVGEKELIDAGLLSESAESGRVYDRFRARVMYPIRDYLGRVVAFGGRVLDDAKPKYLNSPETEVFKKGETLYGLDLARKSIHDNGEAVVVEGYMDVIAMHQHGFTGAVASLGTALTAEHAHLLSRQGARRLALLFDNDEAGQRATLAGLDQEIGRMFLVRAVVAPGGKDSADILLAGGRDNLAEALAGGLSEVEFRFAAVLEKNDPTTLEGKRAILQALGPALRPRDVFDPVANELRRLVSDRLGLNEKRLDEWLSATASRGTRSLDSLRVGGMLRVSSGANAEVKLAQLVIQNPALVERLDLDLAFENRLVAEVIAVARECTTTSEVLARFSGRPEAAGLFAGLFEGPETGLLPDRDEAALDQIASLRREIALKSELAQLRARVAKAKGDEEADIIRQVGELQRAVEAERRLRLRA